jgi:hypothetical protein
VVNKYRQRIVAKQHRLRVQGGRATDPFSDGASPFSESFIPDIFKEERGAATRRKSNMAESAS